MIDNRWYQRCGSRRFAPVADGPTALVLASLADDGCRAMVTLFDDGDVPIASSSPVTLRIEPVRPGARRPPLLSLASARLHGQRLTATVVLRVPWSSRAWD